LPGLMFPNTSPPFVVTEGITDFYVYSMVKDQTDLFDDCEISIIPGHGVHQLQSLISLAIAWSDPYVVIFDKDEAAENAIKRYVDKFGEEQHSKYWIQIDNVNQDEEVALERLFSEKDRDRLLQLASASKLKRGFEILYYSDTITKQKFWDDIDEENRQNFSLVTHKIRDIVGAAVIQETDLDN
jgi:predicted ATP-dependent endonuclease of OLD family